VDISNAAIKQEFIDSINRVNGTSLTRADMTLDDVSTATGNGINSSVVGNAIAGTDSNVKGSKTFLYNRINLASISTNLCKTLTARPVQYLAELLPDINKATKLGLTVDDIINDKVDLKGEEGETVTVRCNPSSPKYTGSMTFTMHLTGTVLLRGKMSVVKGKKYSIYPNSTQQMVINRPFTLFTINGVVHDFDDDGSFTALVETGEWDFYYCTVYLSIFGRNAPITRIDRLMCVDGSLSTGGTAFSYNNSLVSIGDDVFRGNVGPVTLWNMFVQCRNLETIGEDFMAAPDGYVSLEGTFNGCTALKRIGDTRVRVDEQPYTSASSMFYNCDKLEYVPANLFGHASKLNDLNNAFYRVGLSTTDGCWFGESLLDDATALTALGNTFSYVKASAWPVKMFKNHPKVNALSSTFRLSNLTTIPDGMLDKCSTSLSTLATFSGCRLEYVGAKILPQGGSCSATNMFSSARIEYMSTDVFVGNSLSDANGMFSGANISGDFPNIFAGQNKFKSLASIFSSATLKLTDANKALFNDTTAVTDITSMFNLAVLDAGGIPVGFFDKLINVVTCNSAFSQVRSTSADPINIPAGLFAKMAKATDFTSVFSSAKNVKFSGSLLPDSKSALILTNAFNSCQADDYPDNLLTNAENVTAAAGLFNGTNLSSIDGKLIGTLTSVKDLSSAFRTSVNLTIRKGAFDNLPNLTTITNLVGGGSMSRITLVIEEGAFDGAVGLTSIYRAFGFLAEVTIPKNLFKNSKALVNASAAFERSKLRGTLDGFFSQETANNPAASVGTIFSQCDITNLDVGGKINLPMQGSAVMVFANVSRYNPVTVEDFVAWLGVTDVNHFSTDKVQTGFILNDSWIQGDTDTLVRGLWRVDDASVVDTATRKAVLGRA